MYRRFDAFYFLLPHVLIAAPLPIQLSNNKIYYFTNEALNWLITASTVPFATIQTPEYTRQFQPLATLPSVQKKGEAVWFKFSIQNASPQQKTWYLVSSDNRCQWDLYPPQGEKAGTPRNPFVGCRKTALPVTIPGASTQTIYLKRKAQFTDPITFNFVLMTPYRYAFELIKRQLWIGILVAMPLYLILHSLVIFFQTWNKDYLYYIALLIFEFAFLVVSMESLDFFFYAQWESYLKEIVTVLFGVTYLIFGFHMSKPKIRHFPNRPLYTFTLIGAFPVAYLISILSKQNFSAVFLLTFCLLLLIGYLRSVQTGKNIVYHYLIGLLLITFAVLLIEFRNEPLLETARTFGLAYISYLTLNAGLIVNASSLVNRYESAIKQKAAIRENLKSKLIKDREMQRQHLIHRRKVLETYQKFVPENLLPILDKESILAVNFCDSIVKKMTVMFIHFKISYENNNTDAHSHQFTIYNETVRSIEKIINQYHGAIDKFMRDGVLSLFNYPNVMAVKAALEISSFFNREALKKIYPSILPCMVAM